MLSAGTRLGPYEVLGRLGAGGMGEVYRARDPRLSREVAVKVLPSEFASDSSRLKRFEKEARSASALNHPNIVTIYEIGTAESISYIAMELVEGKTLRELLYAGPLPIKRVLQLSPQIADGLARAHEAGIVHRDLKPENVMVTKDGRVKILDFGLAKLTYTGVESGEGTNLPTETGTGAGVVLGTVGYMSPEQASGQPVDFRSDQFSFGSILYEMGTGKRAFQKATAVDTLSAILHDEPKSLAEINPEIPAPLRWIVERCLAKEPEGRYASTRDLARDLSTLQDHLSEAGSAVVASGLPARRKRVLGVTASLALVVVAAAAGAFILFRRSGDGLPASFQRLTFRRGYVWSARFTPDGQTVIYGAAWDGKPVQLYSTRPESPESVALPLPSADVLAVSSSGEMAISLGRHFVDDWLTKGRLARVPISGNAPREMIEDVLAADWSPDGTSLAVVRSVGGQIRLEFPVGKTLYETIGWISHPRISPKGDLVAFIDRPYRWGDVGSIAVVDMTGKRTTLSDGWQSNQGLAWSPNGEEVWFTASSKAGFAREVHAVSPSGGQRTVTQLSDNLTIHDISRQHPGRALLARDRVRAGIIGLAPDSTKERDLSWLNLSIVTDLSTDGGSILFHEMAAGAKPAVYLRSMDGSPAVQLGEGFGTALSSDGKLALAVAPSGQLLLLPTGAGETRPLERGGIAEYSWARFLTADRILIVGAEKGKGVRLFLQDLSGGVPRPISKEGIDTGLGQIAVSPDGKSVAAIGPDRTIQLFPLDGEAPGSIPGASEDDVPVQWSADGKSLYVFRRGELPTRVFKLDVSTGRRDLWIQLMPSDPAGVNIILTIRMTPDGKSYAYSYGQVLSELYLVNGLR